MVKRFILTLFHSETGSYLTTQNDLELVDSQGSSQLPKHGNYRMYTMYTVASSVRKDVCMHVHAMACGLKVRKHPWILSLHLLMWVTGIKVKLPGLQDKGLLSLPSQSPVALVSQSRLG